jgi:hypothetical protein
MRKVEGKANSACDQLSRVEVVPVVVPLVAKLCRGYRCGSRKTSVADFDLKEPQAPHLSLGGDDFTIIIGHSGKISSFGMDLVR